MKMQIQSNMLISSKFWQKTDLDQLSISVEHFLLLLHLTWEWRDSQSSILVSFVSNCKGKVTIQLQYVVLLKGYMHILALKYLHTHIHRECPLKFKGATGNYHWPRVLTPPRETWEEMLHWIIPTNYFLPYTYGSCVCGFSVVYMYMCIWA